MTLQLPIYLDSAATTKLDPRVLEKMMPFLTNDFGNPASRSHGFGWTAEAAVEHAREQVASTVGCDSKEIIWTSGATESINLAVKGAALFYQDKGKHLITVKTEHKATLDTMRELERIGFEVTYLTPETNGLLDLTKLAAAIRPDTILISVMYVNNEIGVVQDVAAIGNLCREKGIIFHVDAAQAVGKVKFSLADLNVDLMSFSAHKVYGPKGIGGLITRKSIMAISYGGGQERRLRPGTLPVPLIVGLSKAIELIPLWLSRLPFYQASIDQIKALLPLDNINSPVNAVPSILNFTVKGADWERMFQVLNGLAFSNGSACNAKTELPSHVLKAVGRSDEDALASARFSLGFFTTDQEVERVCELLTQNLPKLR